MAEYKLSKYIITATPRMKEVQQYVTYGNTEEEIEQKIQALVERKHLILAEDASQSADVLQAKLDALSREHHRQRYIVANADIDLRGRLDSRGRKCVFPRRNAYLFRGFIGWMVHNEEGERSFGNLDISEGEKNRLHQLGLKVRRKW